MIPTSLSTQSYHQSTLCPTLSTPPPNKPLLNLHYILSKTSKITPTQISSQKKKKLSLMAAAISNSLSQTQLKFSLVPSQKPLNLKFKHWDSNLGRGKFQSISAKCCLNLPLKLKSPVGRSLSSVLQNEPHCFYDAVSVELNRIAEDRDAAFARFDLSLGSSEASLHR